MEHSEHRGQSKCSDPETFCLASRSRSLNNGCATMARKRNENLILAAIPEDDYRQVELKRIMAQAILKLKPRDREIILLQHFHGLSYSEIAESLDIPIGTVMSRLYNARSALRKLLERGGQFGGPDEL